MSEATSQNGRMIHLQQYLIEYYFTKQKMASFCGSSKMLTSASQVFLFEHKVC